MLAEALGITDEIDGAARARPEKVSATAAAPRSSSAAPVRTAVAWAPGARRPDRAARRSPSRETALVEAGAEVQQQVRDVGAGRLIASVKDADGNVIGLVQPA
ncbi:MAG: glyoxalase [Pseudonocardia sp.]|nr:glyoxalase [Pseudonocardia sp.]